MYVCLTLYVCTYICMYVRTIIEIFGIVPQPNSTPQNTWKKSSHKSFVGWSYLQGVDKDAFHSIFHFNVARNIT